MTQNYSTLLLWKFKFAVNNSSQTKLLLKLSQESAVRAELQAKLSQQEQVLVSSWHNVTELESEMAKERSQTHECKIQIQLLEVSWKNIAHTNKLVVKTD